MNKKARNEKIAEDIHKLAESYFESQDYSVAAYLAAGATMLEIGALSIFNKEILLPLGTAIAIALGANEADFDKMEKEANQEYIKHVLKKMNRNN